MATSTIKINDNTLDGFYKDNPGFDILHFDFHNKEDVSKLKLGTADQTPSLEKLKAYQRLLRVEPNPDLAVVLSENSMDSARKITAISQSQFIREFGPKLQGGAKAAKQVYQNANAVKTQTMHLWANVNHLKKSPHYMGMNAAPAAQSVADTFENLSSYQDIFGSLNYCDCPECKSILGPAAYLVDLLRLIDKAITKPNVATIPKGLTFDDRRPDISKIKLTCGNTNNLVPYLQIANEILEETLANPKALNTSDVYKTLTSLFYPFNLPFNLPLAQIRTYLKQNNTSLSEIYQAMNKDKSSSLPIAAAREYLNISQEELSNFKAQAVANLPTVLSNNYGLTITATDLAGLNKVDKFTSQAGLSLNDLRELLYQNLNPEEIFNVSGVYIPTINGDTITFTQYGNVVTADYTNQGKVNGSIINNVVQGTWNDASGSGYCEFTFSPDCSSFTGNWNNAMGQPWKQTNWNGTRKTGTDPSTNKPYPTASGGIIPHNFFINQAFTNESEYLAIQLNTTDKTNEYYEILNQNIGSLDTLNRFIRISQKLGWTYAELDWILLTVSSLVTTGSRDIGDDTFQELAKIKQLEDEYSLPRSLQATLWYDIQTTGIGTGQFSEALFDEIFNGPEQIGSTESSPYHPVYPDGYTRFINPLYQTKVETWGLNKLTPLDSTGDTIVAGIPVSTDSIRLIAKAVLGEKDFIDLTVENLSVLYRHAMLAKTLNMQAEEYLLLLKLLGITNKTNTSLISSALTPDQALMIVKNLKWMRACGLNAFAISYICDGTTSQYVSSGYDEKNIPSFVKSLYAAIQNALLKPISFSGYGIPQNASSAAFTWLSSNEYVSSVGLALNSKPLKISDLPNTLPLPDGSKFVLNDDQKIFIVSTVETCKQNQKKSFVTQLASFFGMKGDSISPVIDQVQTLLDKPDYLESFIKPNESETFVNAFIKSVSRFILFYKSLLLNNTPINGIIQNPDAYAQIYTVNKEAFTITFQLNNIHEIYAFTRLEANFDDQKNQLVAYFANAGTTDYQDALDELANITGWDKDQMDNLLEYFLGKGNKCTTVIELAQLNQVFTITQELGIDVYFMSQLNGMASWTSAADNWDSYNSYSASLLQKVSANSSSEAWPSTFKKMNGSLEEAKRDAMLNLTVWEVGKNFADITTPDNLYEFLLIDVKRGGCQDISYIKQALNSAQLYLQRCRLNLERNVVIDKADLPDIYWEWIMNYRVWEANREVFLYPENYIDPSLRKSKTDLFKTLENDLSQGNVTKDTVEAAYRKYLDSFQELATLKYVDSYRCYTNGQEDEESDTLFLFARTQVEPYQYYYISRSKGDIWSQWNKVNITINASNVTAIYAFNKLFIFWRELTKLTQNDNSSANKKRTNIKASIKYSFYNFSGDWAQPQTLVKDRLIYVSGCEAFVKKITNTSEETLPSDLFDMTQLCWEKVNVINIEHKNYWRANDNRSKSDKLLVFFGPLLDTGNYSSVLTQPDIDTTDLVGIEFEESLNTSVGEINQVIKTNNSRGYIPLSPAIVLEDNLSHGFLIYPDEFVLIEKNQAKLFPPNVPFLNDFNQSLYLLSSDCLIRSNYIPASQADSVTLKPPAKLTQSSFIATNPAISAVASAQIFQQLIDTGYIDDNGNLIIANMDFDYLRSDLETILAGQPNEQAMVDYVFSVICGALGTPVLFTRLNSSQDILIAVNNDPYSFVVNHGTESFLITDDKEKPCFINTQTNVLEALFNETSFKTEAISEGASSLIYTQLQVNGYLDDEGRLYKEAGYDDTLAVLKQILSGQPNKNIMVQESINILFHQPMFEADSFKTTLITSAASGMIFGGLQNNGYIDDSGRLNANYSMEDVIDALKTILAGQPHENAMIEEVVSIIIDATRSCSIKYFKSTTNPKNSCICDYQFNAIRLTTSAIKRLSSTLFSEGIEGLLALSSQQIPVESGLSFNRLGASDLFIVPPDAIDGDQVDFSGPFGNYYWELFFHGPMLVAEILNNNQKFQDAENWLQYIFNPTLSLTLLTTDSFETDLINSTDSSTIYSFCKTQKLIDSNGFVTDLVNTTSPARLVKEMNSAHVRLQTNINTELTAEVLSILQNNYIISPLSRYWQFQPLRNHSLKSLIKQLTNPNEIHAYDTDPFDPHAIARLRIGAYEKSVVMKYIENLISWGDSEFRLYTWESITAALMLYVYAYDLLGHRPQDLGPCQSEFPVDFNEILKKYSSVTGGIPQFLIDMENAISSSIPPTPPSAGGDIPYNDIEAYFCVPENETFISKWDTVESRLYNIRHCLNIDGVPQPLPLFQPPIDPMALVKAAASGNNMLDVASLTQPNIPPYRFSYMVEQAKSLTSTVTQLGNNLLSVLEKNDAEGMALLQSINEINILNLTTQVKQQQIQELQDQLEALQQSLQSAQNRETYYSQLISVGLNGFEIADLALRAEAIIPQGIAAGINGVSIAGYLAPNIFGFADGGMKFGDAINAGAQISSITAEILNQTAGIVSTAGSYERRQDEWQFQKDTAGYDIVQITNQLNANEVSIAISQQDLVIHQKNIEQSQAIDNFLKSKFTNQDLYQWMISRLSSLYFQTYNLAESMALRAQAAYQFELDSSDQMISFNYWDDLHKGLLSGESLMMSIQQMESAYIQNNTRRLEIEKTVSICQQFPEEFLKFKWGHNGGTQGTLDFTLSEKLFDFDFPSHYCRKIKSISVSIPAIVGPYQNLNATLRQNSNMVLLSANTDAVKYAISRTVPNGGDAPSEPSSSILRQNWVPDQAIAVSKGVDDNGMFVLDFRDERYLPFEGTGAVSTWTLSLPPSTNRINFDSISDVIINIKYTAKEGGEDFSTKVKAIYSGLPNSSGDYVKAKTFDLRQAFSGNWMQMFNTPPDASGQQSISFPLTDNYWLTNLGNVTVENLMVQFEVSNEGSLKGSNFLQLKVGINDTLFDVKDNFAAIDASDLQSIGFGISTSICTLVFDITNAPDSITKTLGSVKMLDETKLMDMAVVIVYTEKPF